MHGQNSARYPQEIAKVELKAGIGAFFVEFSKFEVLSIGMALRSLSKDAVFVEQAEKLLDLEARLKLLERMAFAKAVGSSLIAELDALLIRARRLCAERDEVARNSANAGVDHVKPYPVPAPGSPKPLKARSAVARLAQMSELLTPTVAQIQAYTDEAIELQQALRTFSEKIDQQVPVVGIQVQAAG
jgi:hypothetical protein